MKKVLKFIFRGIIFLLVVIGIITIYNYFKTYYDEDNIDNLKYTSIYYDKLEEDFASDVSLYEYKTKVYLKNYNKAEIIPIGLKSKLDEKFRLGELTLLDFEKYQNLTAQGRTTYYAFEESLEDLGHPNIFSEIFVNQNFDNAFGMLLGLFDEIPLFNQ